MIPPFVTLSNIRYISRVKWSNPGKNVVPSPIEKGAFGHPQLQLLTLHTFLHASEVLTKKSLATCLPLLLYFDLRPGQKCHSKVMHRKEVTHSNGIYERKSRGQKLADEMGWGKKNSHGTLIDWCTGRE